MRKLLCFLFGLFVLTAALSSARAVPQVEHIILTGGPALQYWEKYKAQPHDIWWGNFVRASRVRIQQLRKEYGPNARITWLIYKRGYERRGRMQDNRDLIALIRSVEQTYNVRLIWFESGQEVINYLNRGLPRNQVKIANFDFYGHSNSRAFLFDYSNEVDSSSKSWLHENDLKKINRSSFAKNAKVKSWGCHTAESMSQKWRQATGTKMVGAIGKTDYSHGFRYDWIPQLSPGGRWGY
ncbi:MAG: hypothetical protein ACK5NG_08485 [Chthoniobacterales bacterium]